MRVLAERAGFEPALGYYPKHAFQTSDFYFQNPVLVRFSEDKGILLSFIGPQSGQFILARGAMATIEKREYWRVIGTDKTEYFEDETAAGIWAAEHGGTPEKTGEQWRARVRRKGHPAQSRAFRTKTEAQDWAKQVEVDMRRGAFVSISAAERTTFSDLAKDFRSEFAPKHYRVRADGKEAWRFQLARLEDFFGQYSLAVIDQKLVAKYRDLRLQGTTDRKAVGESTARKEIFLLSKVFSFAETEKGITLPRGNPVSKIRKPSDGTARDRRLTADEWKKLEAQLRRSRSPYLWPAVQLAVETAMRQGELLALDWRNIDRDRAIAFLPETKNGEARAVPLSSRALAMLKGLPRTITGAVLPVERLTLYHAFIAACKRAEIQDFTFHDLRHEALSRLAERGDFSVLELAEVSGHKTLQMLKRYTHLNAERLAKKLG